MSINQNSTITLKKSYIIPVFREFQNAQAESDEFRTFFRQLLMKIYTVESGVSGVSEETVGFDFFITKKKYKKYKQVMIL